MAARETLPAPASTIGADTRELIMQLSRGNADPAHTLARRVHAELNVILSSDLEPESTLKLKARQTMFAIEEVMALVDRSDLRGAWEAARDAAKEWRVTTEAHE